MEKSILNTILFFLLCAIFQSCLKEDELKLPFTTYSPHELTDGWAVSTPENESMDGTVLKDIYQDFHQNKDLWQVRSLLVFRNNKLVAESYTKDIDDRTRPAAIWSCTKQVMAILTGIALEGNIIGNVDDPIEKYLPDLAKRYPDKGAIRLCNLLTMRSGIKFENYGLNGGSNMLLRQIPDSSIDFILGLPVIHEQGEVFNYNDGDPHILSAILQSQTGKSVCDWAREVLFTKLGMQNYDWIVYKDGITMGAFGILATPREMAKIGQLVLNGGRWDGNRIVSDRWIGEIASTKVPASEVAYYDKSFGYYWWIDEGRGIVFMNGQGGQYVFVNPTKNLLVVTTAEPNTQGKHQFSISKAFEVFDRIDSITY